MSAPEGAVALLLLIALEIVHKLLPPGTHFKFVDKYLTADEEDTDGT